MDQKLSYSALPYQKVNSLSQKELEILILVASGLNSKEISIGVDILPKSIDNYKNRIGKKLGLKGYGSLCCFARDNKDILYEWSRYLLPFVYDKAVSFSNVMKMKKMNTADMGNISGGTGYCQKSLFSAMIFF